jgi:acetyltransferase-like isoleucine patch superfamily enzyme
MKELAPIVLFAYNRPWHTRQTLEALSNNELSDQSELFIFCDGAKVNADPNELVAINEVRDVVYSQQWCKNVIIEISEKNLGLAESIQKGVTKILDLYEKVIVLEDDIVPSVGFLDYMNRCLTLYENSQEIFHVSAYLYPNSFPTKDQIYFLKVLSCWGWGTWTRAWAHLQLDFSTLISDYDSEKKIAKFNIEGNADYFKQLEDNYNGKINTWAVKWYASWIRVGGISIFPGKSLVRNIGFDASGENCYKTNVFETAVADKIDVKILKIKENKKLRFAIDEFYAVKFRGLEKSSISIIQKIKGFIYQKIRSLIIKFLVKFVPEFQVVIDKNRHIENLIESSPIDGVFNCSISKHVKLNRPCNIVNTTIGAYTYIAQNCKISEAEIGKFCSIGPNLLCGWGIHPTNGISTAPMFYSILKQNGMTLSSTNKIEERKKITIGNDVFIGANVTILDGVTIGDGAVIGAGAIVSKNIPPYAIAAGNPIQILRFRFPEQTIQELLHLQWWEWDEERLKQVERLFFDVDNLIELNKTITQNV